MASISVTDARNRVMDFVEYFLEYGGVILRMPDDNENKWRVILQPFRYVI